jgi:hypothetical protein
MEGSSMKTTVMILVGALAVSGAVSAPTQTQAAVIENACRTSGRSAASRSLCSCIQTVANVKLKRTDQRKAAKFFNDPHLAQETRQSSNSSKEAFWLRYKAFSAAAERSCS